MIEIRYVRESDRAFWFSLDRHLPESEFTSKVRDRRGYVLIEDGVPAALMRWNLFWDSIPFCTMLYVRAESRRCGLGNMLTAHWEAKMRALGHDLCMISTQSDEAAQHFYRKLGYKDAGCLLLDTQPAELFFTKSL